MAASLILITIACGVPVLLVFLGSVLPVDLTALAPSALTHPDDGGLVLLLLLAVAWGAWAAMTLSVAVEVWAAIRRVPSPRLPGLAAPQRLAASLVAIVLVALAPGVTSASPAAAAHGARGESSLALLMTSASALVEGPVLDRAPPAATDIRTSSPQQELPSVTTQRHDTLWSLAERHLGAGERFTEIAALNEGAGQADGRALSPDGRLYPGWVLKLPADAEVDASLHVVERGDTLWAIAEDELGDGTRYPEIFEANEGDRQADGRRLTDADLILPGWRLEIPADQAAASRDGSDSASTEGETTQNRSGDADERQIPDPSLGSDESDDSENRQVAPTAVPEIATSPTARSLPPLDRSATRAAGEVTPSDPATSDPAPVESAQPSSPERSAPASEETAPAADRSPESVPPPSGSGSVPPIDRAAMLPDSAIPLPAGGVIGVLLLAGVAGELTRRRRQFQRHRRPGERMPVPGAAASAVEAAARAASTDAAPELLDQALGALARRCRESGAHPARIRSIRLTADSVRLHLAEPRDLAIAPFRAVDEREWELDRTLLGSFPEPLDDEAGHGLQGLVTLGMRDQETVLVNLAEVGTLLVSGAADPLPGVIRALASEIALGPAGDGAARTLCLSDDRLSEAIRSAMEAGDLTVETDPLRLARTLSSAMRRGPQDPSEGDPLELALTDRPLACAVPGGSGAGLITTDPRVTWGSRLTLHDDGSARLDPEGLDLIPQSLAAGASEQLVELLRSTELPLTMESEPWPVAAVPLHAVPMTAPPPQSRLVGDLRAIPDPVTPRAVASDTVPQRPTSESRPSSAASGARQSAAGVVASDAEIEAGQPSEATSLPEAPRILLLGEVRVENAHGKAESTRVGRLAETAAFVLLNPGARPSELQSALWPGRRSSPSTCRQMISRTRTWLGRTADAEPYLMQLADSDGRLRLRQEVGADWADFQALAARGLADPDDTAHLSEALALVRGRPFGSVAARELPWADLFINEMICQITDVAHELALRYERAGQWSAAREAALRGLRTECESEMLEAIVARLGRSA